MDGIVFRETGMGLFQWKGPDVIIAGGMRAMLPSAPGVSRLRFSAYGVPEFKEHGATKAMLGHLELNVVFPEDDDPFVEGLIFIGVDKANRRRGYGTRIVAAVSAISPEGLKVYDIKPSAIKFWRSLGLQMFENRRGLSVQLDGQLAAPMLAPMPCGP